MQTPFLVFKQPAVIDIKKLGKKGRKWISIIDMGCPGFWNSFKQDIIYIVSFCFKCSAGKCTGITENSFFLLFTYTNPEHRQYRRRQHLLPTLYTYLCLVFLGAAHRREGPFQVFELVKCWPIVQQVDCYVKIICTAHVHQTVSWR